MRVLKSIAVMGLFIVLALLFIQSLSANIGDVKILNYDPKFSVSIPTELVKDISYVESIDGNINLSFIPKELSFTNATGNYKIKPGEPSAVPLVWFEENRTGRYYGAFQNRADLLYRYEVIPGQPTRLKELVYVSNQSFFGNLTQGTLVIFKHRINFSGELDLYIGGVKWNNETNIDLKGNDAVFKRANVTFRTFPKPYILDNKGMVYYGNYSFMKKTTGAPADKGLLVKIEFNANDLINATYPLVLDPSITNGVTYSPLVPSRLQFANYTNGSGSPKYIGAVQSLASCGNNLYISDTSDDRLSIYNLTNKTSITISGSVSISGNLRTASTSSDCNWVFLSGDYPGAFYIINATDKTSPVITGSIVLTSSPDGATGSAYVESKDVVYVSVSDTVGTYQNSVVSINVSNKNSPVVLDSITHNSHDIKANETVAIAVGYTTSDVRTYNVTNQSDIILLDTFTHARLYHSYHVLWTSGSQYAYISSDSLAGEQGSFIILNVSDFADIKYEGSINYTFPRTSTFVLDGTDSNIGYLTGADPSNILAVVDISNKKDPRIIESFSGMGAPYYLYNPAATALEYVGGYIYVGAYADNAISIFKTLNATPVNDTDWDTENVLENGDGTFELDLQWSNYSFYTAFQETVSNISAIRYFNHTELPTTNLVCNRSDNAILLNSGTSLNTYIKSADGNDYVVCGDAGDFISGSNDFTVSVNATTTDGYGAYIATRGYATGYEDAFAIIYGDPTANKATLQLIKTTGGNAITTLTSTTSVTDGVNHTITTTKCGDNVNLYVDGADKRTASGISAYLQSTPFGLYIGNFRDPAQNQGLIGTIDNVVIYPFCANDTQVLDIHQNKRKLSGNIIIKDGRQLDAGTTNKWSSFRVNGTEWSTGSSYTLEINGSADNTTWSGNQTANNTLGMNSNISIDSSYQYRYIRPKFTMNASTTKYWSPLINYLEFIYTNVPLSFSTFTPAGDVSVIKDNSQAFSVTLNRAANITWKLDGASVQTNNSITIANYTNNGAVTGTFNITVNATDGIDSVSRTWFLTVSAQTTTSTSRSGGGGSSISPVTTETPTAWSDGKKDYPFSVLFEGTDGRMEPLESGKHGITALNMFFKSPVWGTYTITISTYIDFKPPLNGSLKYFSISPNFDLKQDSSIELTSDKAIELYQLYDDWKKLPKGTKLSNNTYRFPITSFGVFAVKGAGKGEITTTLTEESVLDLLFNLNFPQAFSILQKKDFETYGYLRVNFDGLSFNHSEAIKNINIKDKDAYEALKVKLAWLVEVIGGIKALIAEKLT